MAVKSFREFPYNEARLEEVTDKANVIVDAMINNGASVKDIVRVVDIIIQTVGEGILPLFPGLQAIYDEHKSEQLKSNFGAGLAHLQYEVGTLYLKQMNTFVDLGSLQERFSVSGQTLQESHKIAKCVAYYLIKEYQQPLGVIGFYSHHKLYREFSNFHPCHIEIDGHTFNWSEQYLMWLKATMFGDHESARQILLVTNPKDAKALGRDVKPFDPVRWDKEVRNIAYKIVWEKFSQNPDLAEILLSTGSKIIAEAAPRDTNWGVGKGVTPDLQDKWLWRGTNVLGEALMRVRRDLRKIKSN